MFPPAMAQDQSYQVSSQNSKIEDYFLLKNPMRVYPTVIANLKKGRPSLRSGLNKFDWIYKAVGVGVEIHYTVEKIHI